MAVKPQTPKCHHNRSAAKVCGATTMNENEVAFPSMTSADALISQAKYHNTTQTKTSHYRIPLYFNTMATADALASW